MAKDIKEINESLQKEYDSLDVDAIIKAKIAELPKGKKVADFFYKHINLTAVGIISGLLIGLAVLLTFTILPDPYFLAENEHGQMVETFNIVFIWQAVALSIIVLILHFVGRSRSKYWAEIYTKLLNEVLTEYDVKDKLINNIKVNGIGIIDKMDADRELKKDAQEMMQDVYLLSEKVKSNISTVGSTLSFASMLLTGNGSKVTNRWVSSSTSGEFNVSDNQYRFRNFMQVFKTLRTRTVPSKNGSKTVTYYTYDPGQTGIVVDIENHSNSSKFKNFMIAEERNIVTAPTNRFFREKDPFEDIEFNKSFSVYKGNGLSEVEMFNIMSAKAIDKLVTEAPTYPGFVLSTNENGKLQLIIYSPDRSIIPFTMEKGSKFARNDEYKEKEMKTSIYLLISARKIIKTLESAGII